MENEVKVKRLEEFKKDVAPQVAKILAIALKKANKLSNEKGFEIIAQIEVKEKD